MSIQFLQTPIGILTLQEKGNKLIRVAFLFGRKAKSKESFPEEFINRYDAPLDAFSTNELHRLAQERYGDILQTTVVLEQTRQELLEYFDGTRKEFDIPLDLIGTNFQRNVWQALANVAYGSVETYGNLAQRIGAPKSARAVGAAMRNNPIGIILPCHRIVGSLGKLTGYNGGLDRKAFLLKLEANVLNVDRRS